MRRSALSPALATLILALTAASGCSVSLGAFGPLEPLEETTVVGESGPKILLLEFDGVLSEDRRGGPFTPDRPGILALTREQLDRAEDDDDIAALLLRINSPGGTVSMSEALHHEIGRWRDKTGRPVIAFLQGLATSGGYYVAMTADTLIAQPGTVTGSIGVVMVNLNVAGLLEKVGAKDQTMKSGAFKDTGSMLREMRPEERDLLQKVVDDLHGRFREVVLAGRPEFTSEKLQGLADGRIFTARQAEQTGLIDRVGHLEDAIDALEDRLGVEESRLVVYHRPNEYRTTPFMRPAAPAPLVDVDVLNLGAGPLQPGFYYLWPLGVGQE